MSVSSTNKPVGTEIPRPVHVPSARASSDRSGVSRRQFLQFTGGVAGAAAVGAGAFELARILSQGSVRPSLPAAPVKSSGPVRNFHSRPDLRPPTVTLTKPPDIDGGYLFMGPWANGGNQPGPLMVDGVGEPVWFNPISSGHTSSQWATNFQTFTYRGEPVLAWWEGKVLNTGLGQGEAILVDRAYREVARVRAANGRQMDLHEFQLTPQGTALFTCYPEPVQADLSSIGGPSHGTMLASVFQEVDVRTGRLLLEWRGLDHIPVSDSYKPFKAPYEYLHINSIQVLPDGNLLVSARHTWALYKIDRRTGNVIWRLGGKNSDFNIASDAKFSWQHHARQPADGTITLFDNGSDGPIETAKSSKGLLLNVDEAGKKVTLGQSFNHPPPVLSSAMGSVQILPNGNVAVGWGTEPYLSEFTPTGELLSDARLLSGEKSYRGLLLPWHGSPEHAPALTVGRTLGRKTTVWASWNGDTRTAFWRVHSGDYKSSLREIGIARRRAFETAIPVGDVDGYFAVEALDSTGQVLGHSTTIRL